MPRWSDGTWISDRQATLRNEAMQLRHQISDPRWSDKDKSSYQKRLNKISKKIK
jgi:hypothetical protein